MPATALATSQGIYCCIGSQLADGEHRGLHAAAAATRRRGSMIQVDPRTRSALWGPIGAVLAAGWVAYAMLGNGSHVFLTVMLVLTIILGGVGTYFVRVRLPN
jgi:hypothetical protein